MPDIFMAAMYSAVGAMEMLTDRNVSIDGRLVIDACASNACSLAWSALVSGAGMMTARPAGQDAAYAV